MSHAHDALYANYDRDFRGIFLFLDAWWKGIAPQVGLRVFDVGRGCQQHEVTAHVFNPENMKSEPEYVDLVAFRHHMRWAKPCNDVPQTKWRDWRGDFDRIIEYPRIGWKTLKERTGMEGRSLVNYPCECCRRRHKVFAESKLYDAVEIGMGGDEDRPNRVEPNHRTGMMPRDEKVKIYPTEPLSDRTGVVEEEVQMEERNIEVLETFPPPSLWNRGVDERQEEPLAELLVGEGIPDPNEEYPIREREWRFTHGINDTARDFMKMAQGSEYTPELLNELMQMGDKLVKEYGDVRDAARQIQEYRFRLAENLIGEIEEVKHLSPKLGGEVQEIHRLGVCPVFRGDTPKGERERGFPHGRGQSPEIVEKLWKDVKGGKMFICSARTVGAIPELWPLPRRWYPNACLIGHYQRANGS